MSKHRSINDGDWICSDADCSNINFSWRAKCNKCGRDKGKVEVFKKTGTEIGKKAAEKSGGLFSADDWHCSSCGNVNWARRTDCNICHAPKYGTIEPRTGLGGGYNERENVEYFDREESEDEYDDFGRRKKKYRHKSNDKNDGSKTKGMKEKEKVMATVHKNNDQEDSGEEFDLSKFEVVGDARDEQGEEEEEEEDDDDDEDVDLSKYDFGDDSPVQKPSEENKKAKEKAKVRSRSRSPLQKNNRSSSPSPRRHSRSSPSRSRSRDRRKHRSRSCERSRSPVRKQRSYRSRSRSRSRERDKGSSYGRSRRSRSRSRERRPSRRSRSRSRSRDRDRRRSARSRSRDRYR